MANKTKWDIDNKFKKKYTCSWCGHIFFVLFKERDDSSFGKRKVSNQVQCPNCENFNKNKNINQ